MENKKIRGATKKEYKGIQFDSNLEVSCYKKLEEANISFEYNSYTYTIFPGLRLDKINYYQAIPKDKVYTQIINKQGGKLKITAIKYTPDFIISGLPEGIKIFIETKGRENDVYPYKRKLFFKLLEDSNLQSIYFFEPRNVRQIKESIEIIKRIINDTKTKNKVISGSKEST